MAQHLGLLPLLGLVRLVRRRQRVLDSPVEALLSAGFVFGEGFIGHG